MARLRKIVHAVVTPGEDGWFVANCLEIAAVTQGRTLDETLANLQEAVGVYLSGQDLSELGFAPEPAISVMIEGVVTT
jgi:predicted RNase H-like HicB family nuclease